uniref:glycosyltransferase family protein n=1 Tax=Paenirhodobacter enshiensis TaxID=1105367 RepID=UPI0035B154A7
MPIRLKNARILMYSHDTFGLGHLRRCRAIAHALVEAFSGLQVLIVSGAQIAGAFDYRARVDFVKIPSVIKLRDGEYTSMAKHMDLSETLRMRRAILLDTARSFRPDIFIVDKEPLGLKGEAEETLAWLKAEGHTRLVLGLRDIMDSPQLLAAEWERRGNLPKIAQYYDDIWVYGPRAFHDPLAGLPVPPEVRARMSFVGFLKRRVRARTGLPQAPARPPYVLVTSGGGGDGAEMTRDAINAWRLAPDLPHGVIVLGPYMPAEERAALTRLARGLPVEIIDFVPKMEELMAGAAGVVCMGGYNTWCEVLSFDKPALIIPRRVPREEQLLRATRAAELGLAMMLQPEEAADTPRLVAAIRALPGLPPPSASGRAPELDGLANIAQIVGDWLEPDRGEPLMRRAG